MKCINTITLLLLVTYINAQNSSTISVGINAIDDSFTTSYNPINLTEQWNVGKIPSYIAISSEIVKRLFLECALTTNDYQKGKLVNGKIITANKEYFAIAISAKYKLFDLEDNVFNSALFDPFVSVGIGETKLDSLDFYTLDYGFGFYFWLPRSKYYNWPLHSKTGSNFGILVSSTGKSSFQQSLYGNHIQHTIGMAFRF